MYQEVYSNYKDKTLGGISRCVANGISLTGHCFLKENSYLIGMPTSILPVMNKYVLDEKPILNFSKNPSHNTAGYAIPISAFPRHVYVRIDATDDTVKNLQMLYTAFGDLFRQLEKDAKSIKDFELKFKSSFHSKHA
jgi:hypothetical protein